MTLDAEQQRVMNKLLFEAVGNRDLGRMKAYVSKGANIHAYIDTVETIRMNGTYTSRGSAPLYHYMMEDYFTPAVSDFFLEQGVKVDARNFNGNTPLMLAVKNGDLTRVRYFLSKGADPLAVNSRGDIVLEEARKLRNCDCADRQNIIDALVGAIGAPAPAAAPQKPVPAVETAHDIQTLKPIEFVPRKKSGGGFNL
jgi:hypothetical protein